MRAKAHELGHDEKSEISEENEMRIVLDFRIHFAMLTLCLFSGSIHQQAQVRGPKEAQNDVKI